MSKYPLTIKRITSVQNTQSFFSGPASSVLGMQGPASAKLPAKIDLRHKMPPVYDQGKIGSCTANALVAVVEYDLSGFNGSRLFVYYNERLLNNTTDSDSGASLSDGIESLMIFGVCKEELHPYDVTNLSLQPSKAAYEDGRLHKALRVKHLQGDLYTLKKCLADGFPFVVSIAMYPSFETKEVGRTGKVPLPSPTEQDLGGHAILICGYDDTTQSWIARNSWGDDWGLEGYFHLPYLYLLDSSLSSDAWVVTKVGPSPAVTQPILVVPRYRIPKYRLVYARHHRIENNRIFRY
jgi:C1A family cysteine protease